MFKLLLIIPINSRSILSKKENDIKCCQAEISQCKAEMKDRDCKIQDLICNLSSKDACLKKMEGTHCKKIQDYEDLLRKSENIERQLRNKILVLTERDKDLKQQLKKCKMDLEIFDEELKSERKTNIEMQELQTENNVLKKELGDHTKQTEALISELQLLKDQNISSMKILEENEVILSQSDC